MTILVIDMGTSSVRAVALEADGTTHHEARAANPPQSPAPGLAEFDPMALAELATSLATTVVEAVGAVDAVAIATQRASTVIWDATTGRAIGPGIGWQDLRTVGRCLALRAEGVPVAPNLSATKAEWLVAQTDVPRHQIRIGTIETWLAWHLSHGAIHVTDATNAAVTGLYDPVAHQWNAALADRLGIPATALATVVDTIGIVGTASRLPGAPPIAALIADQQASLIGQGATTPGQAKITFGTGAMLDVCLGSELVRGATQATFPIVAWRADGRSTFGLEAVALCAGGAVDWLCDGLGLLDRVEDSAALAATVPDSDGVVFVPSLSGLGSPDWDHGARGLLIGLTRGTTSAHVVRAVLEGVAHRGADLVEAIEADADIRLARISVDGGMSANPVFVQALANAVGRPITVSAQREATAVGAGFAAGVAIGVWPNLAATAELVQSSGTVAPTSALDRDRFRAARSRARGWIPALSALDL